MIRRLTFIAIAAAVVVVVAHDAAAQVLHTPHDHVPNFAASPSIRSAAHGAWSSAATWTPPRVPTPADIVGVAHTVVYDTTNGDVGVIGIESGGVLRFAIGQSTRLRVGTLLVLPNGVLEVGSPSSPIPASVTAEIIIKDRAVNLSTDPDQYGTGLLSIDGTVTMHGASKSPTFVRTASEPRAGHTSIVLEHPVAGWQVGDRVFLPDTRQVPADHWFNAGYALHVEERIIQSVSADARSITVTTPLAFDHRGARDASGAPTVVGGVALLPHVGNLTRNVIVSFETPATPGTGADRPSSGVTMVLRNNTVRPWPGRPLETIQMSHTMTHANSQPNDKYDVFVYDYQGQAGNDFRVYFHPQATQSLYGGVAPCNNTTMRPEIDGITCPLTTTPTTPSAPTGFRIIR